MYGNEIVPDGRCSATPKPIKFRPCDSKQDCLWKTDPWRNVSLFDCARSKQKTKQKLQQNPNLYIHMCLIVVEITKDMTY